MIDKDTWHQKGESMTLGQWSIFVVDENPSAKETIIFLHGFPTASWDWVKVWPTLAKEYRCVTLDLLGYGFSDKPQNHKYSILEQADIVEALVESKQLKSFHVLSHDYGDTVAQELLARQNDTKGKGTWKSLCLLNGGLFPETHRALLTQKLLLSPLGPLVSRLTSKSKFSTSFSSTFGKNSQPSQVELDTFWDLITLNDGQKNFHQLIRYIEERKRYRSRWVGAFKNTGIPLALI
ncbi:MAG: alpha/beta hydrolase, partial [Pseudomonadales bacterium]|nr:alpha/beta hydrolase [Pseudomonadales bacterium]